MTVGHRLHPSLCITAAGLVSVTGSRFRPTPLQGIAAAQRNKLVILCIDRKGARLTRAPRLGRNAVPNPHHGLAAGAELTGQGSHRMAF